MRQVKQVKLTTCSEGEFTCNDGQCITMEQRQVCKEYFLIQLKTSILRFFFAKKANKKIINIMEQRQVCPQLILQITQANNKHD